MNDKKQGDDMNTVKNLLGSVAVLAFSGSAMAGPVLVNFQAMADGSYGESAFAPLSLLADFGIDVDIAGTFNGQDVYAYLDAGRAGLGTCRDLNASGDAKLNTKQPGSGSNLCAISSDDNVNTYNGLAEGLRLTFNENISIKKIWFNNNHDHDRGMTGDTVLIGGQQNTFAASDKDAISPNLGWIFEFTGINGDFFFGETLNIDYFIPAIGSGMRGEEFYISAIEFDTVPVVPDVRIPLPSTLALFGIGVAGMAARRRRA
ncbi:MAG: PEP-CTERM sorting domain-containing protein [Halioglobus sp.]|nr:PEP-CTERM sorting domain-containing protein [Halioglobus sp.]